MKGRPPKPVEQKRREGNPGKRKLPEPVLVEGRPQPGSLEPPKGLAPEAREAWERIVPTLEAVGILDGVDAMALEAMVTQWARAKQAGRVIDEFGHAALGSTGQLVEHPALATERSAMSLFLKFAEHYALTPVARTRLGLAELQRKNMMDEMNSRIPPRGSLKVVQGGKG
jgi:hypothetical protein